MTQFKEPTHLCAMAWRDPETNSYKILAVGGKVVVFDAPINAQDFSYKFCGPGRTVHFSEDGETFYYMPPKVGQMNRGVIIKAYDPYNAPAGLGITSEVHGREWRHHVNSWVAFYDCDGNLNQDSNGIITNSAIGDAQIVKSAEPEPVAFT